MKKLLVTLFLFGISFFGFLVILHLNGSVPKAQAVEITMSPADPDENDPSVTITISGLTPDISDFGICLRTDCIDDARWNPVDTQMDSEGTTIVFEVCGNGVDKLKIDCEEDKDFFHAKETYRLSIYNPDNNEDPLQTKAFNVGHAYPDSPNFSTDSPTPSDTLTMTVCGNRYPFGKGDRNKIDLFLDGPGKSEEYKDIKIQGSAEGNGCTDLLTLGQLNTGNYELDLRWAKEDFTLYRINITVSEEGGQITIGKNESGGGSVDEIKTAFDLSCDEKRDCPKEIYTPFGFIGTNAVSFAESILNIGIGIAGGIAFILMIFGAYRLMFAGGNPDAIQQGRDIITAAVVGLIVIVFAVFILSFVGFTILGLNSI